jgi:uncharacterized membrane protein
LFERNEKSREKFVLVMRVVDILIAVVSELVLGPSCFFEELFHSGEFFGPKGKVAVVVGLQLLVLFLQQFMILLELGELIFHCRFEVFDLGEFVIVESDVVFGLDLLVVEVFLELE